MQEKSDKPHAHDYIDRIDISLPSNIVVLWGIHKDRKSGNLAPTLTIKVKDKVVGKNYSISHYEVITLGQMINKHGIQTLSEFIPEENGERDVFLIWIKEMAQRAGVFVEDSKVISI